MSNYYTQELKFKRIPGYEHEYAINNAGKVLSLLTDQYLETAVDTKGYLTVNLYKNGTRKTKRVHNLVANLFVPNPDNLPVVNHIDGNKKNPHYTNLEWTSYSENTRHAHRTGLQVKTSDKRVIRGDGKVYPSLTQASIDNYVSVSAISKAAKGTLKTAGGYTWKLEGGD